MDPVNSSLPLSVLLFRLILPLHSFAPDFLPPSFHTTLQEHSKSCHKFSPTFVLEVNANLSYSKHLPISQMTFYPKATSSAFVALRYQTRSPATSLFALSATPEAASVPGMSAIMSDMPHDLLPSVTTSFNSQEGLIQILPAPSADLFWAAFFGLVVFGLLNPSKSGLKLAPLRPLQGGSLPLEGAKEFDMEKVDYNSLQKFRHQFGYIVAFFLVIAGYLGGYSGLLADEPALQDYARSAVFSLGIGAVPTHFLFNKDRYDNGKQLVKTFGLGLCVAGQVFFCLLTQLWLAQVQMAIPSEYDLQLNALTFSIYGVYASFIILNGIRAFSYIQGGPDRFFEPQLEAEAKTTNE